MLYSHVLLAIGWLLYCILHSAFASTSLKAKAARLFGKHFHYYRLYYNVFAVLSFIAIVLYQITMHSFFLFQPTTLSIVIGAFIGITGLTIMAICILKYFRTLSGIFTEPDATSSNKLYISGIHRFVRHPLYLGTFIFIWGGWIAYPLLSLLISNFIITVYTVIGIQYEEKKLLAFFGDDYKKYQQQVPKLIPDFRKSAY